VGLGLFGLWGLCFLILCSAFKGGPWARVWYRWINPLSNVRGRRGVLFLLQEFMKMPVVCVLFLFCFFFSFCMYSPPLLLRSGRTWQLGTNSFVTGKSGFCFGRRTFRPFNPHLSPPLYPTAKKSCGFPPRLLFLLFPIALSCITLMAARGICSALSVIAVLLFCPFFLSFFAFGTRFGLLVVFARVGAGLWLGWA